MSSLSEQDHLNPNDPSYYAPRWLRERSEPRSSSSQEAISEAARAPVAPPGPLDTEVIRERAERARELDRRAALMSVATRFAAAIGVSAVVALFFVIMVPASRQSDAGGTSSVVCILMARRPP